MVDCFVPRNDAGRFVECSGGAAAAESVLQHCIGVAAVAERALHGCGGVPACAESMLHGCGMVPATVERALQGCGRFLFTGEMIAFILIRCFFSCYVSFMIPLLSGRNNINNFSESVDKRYLF
jgi:hypothetical protein